MLARLLRIKFVMNYKNMLILLIRRRVDRFLLGLTPRTSWPFFADVGESPQSHSVPSFLLDFPFAHRQLSSHVLQFFPSTSHTITLSGVIVHIQYIIATGGGQKRGRYLAQLPIRNLLKIFFFILKYRNTFTINCNQLQLFRYTEKKICSE